MVLSIESLQEAAKRIRHVLSVPASGFFELDQRTGTPRPAGGVSCHPDQPRRYVRDGE